MPQTTSLALSARFLLKGGGGSQDALLVYPLSHESGRSVARVSGDRQKTPSLANPNGCRSEIRMAGGQARVFKPLGVLAMGSLHRFWRTGPKYCRQINYTDPQNHGKQNHSCFFSWGGGLVLHQVGPPFKVSGNLGN